MNRRDFIKSSSLVPVAGIGLRLAGVGAALEVLDACPSEAQWLSAINTILAEAGPAISVVVSLLPLLAKNGISLPSNLTQEVNAWSQKAQADVTQLAAIIDQAKTDIASNTTVQGQINALIQTTQQDLTSIFTIINVVDQTTKAKITAMVTTISAGILSVENIINGITGRVTMTQMKAMKATFVPNGKSFKNAFNNVLHNPTGNSGVDASTAQLSLN